MEKEKNYNLLKATIWYVVSNILVKGVALFVLPIFTRLMTTEQFGIYTTYASYMTIAEVVVLFGLSSTIRIAKYDKELDYEKYVATIIFVPPVLALAFAIPLNIVLLFVNEFLSMSAELWNYMLLTISFAAISNIVLGKLVIDGKYKLYAIYSIVFTSLSIGLSILLGYTFYAGERVYMARVVGGFAANAFATVLLLIFSKTIRKGDLRYIKRALIWGAPLLIHTLATVVLTQTDKIVIRYMDSYSATGIYGIAVTFIAIPMIIYTSFESAWAPWFYKKLNEKNYEEIKSFNNVYILGMCLIVCGFMLASPTLIRLFTEESYWDSMFCLIPLSASVFFELLYGISVSVEYYYKKTWYITLGTIMAVLVNIGLDVLFIYLWGYIAAAYATSISKILLFLFHYFMSKKFDNHRMFSDLFVLLLVVLMSGVAAVSIVLVNVFWARLLIGILLLVLLVLWLLKNKAMIKAVISSKKGEKEICEE